MIVEKQLFFVSDTNGCSLVDGSLFAQYALSNDSDAVHEPTT